MDNRVVLLEKWLKIVVPGIGYDDKIKVTAIAGDASFRRYFRVVHIPSGTSYIAMYAPPDNERCDAFIAIAQAMANIGLLVPTVLAKDLVHGFLLLTDLGDQQYLDRLNNQNSFQLYGDALEALLLLQGAATDHVELPDYSKGLLYAEMGLFDDWFLTKYLGLNITGDDRVIIDKAYEFIVEMALDQPQVWVHRDYHSRNLMFIDGSESCIGNNNGICCNPGILDFQDAVIGPICYDLVSLLRDCYIAWPLDQVRSWMAGYRDKLITNGLISPSIELDVFEKWFDLMGIQRHLKAIGIFSRLKIRDNKLGYLGDIPRTLKYILYVCQKYPEFDQFNDWLLMRVVPPACVNLGVTKDEVLDL